MATVDVKSLLGKLNRFSTRCLEAAAGLCVSRGHYEVTVEHLLSSLIEEPGSDIGEVLRHFEIDVARARKALSLAIEDLRTGNAGRPVFSPLLVEWFQEAWLMASIEHGLPEIRSGILLRALLSSARRLTQDEISGLFDGVRREELKDRYAEIVARSTEGEPAARPAPGRPTGAGAQEGDSALEKYGIDFTERARKGEIDPVFGRDREIRQMIDILARRRKNNPICVGEAGVGKTAVIEGLAVRVVEGDVPEVLKDVRIVGLDMGLLQAGAGVKGEFENRLKNVIEAVKASAKPIILFIDEAHMLIGAGGPAGGDAANLLKPALARGELRTIAATTWSEYKKYFEKDAALARRFQLVKLDEPADDVVVTMLRGLRDRYESSHAATIRDDAIVAAAKLGSRYISGRQHPDKAVDLVDTALARVKIGLTSKPDGLQDLERRIQTLSRELAAHEREKLAGVPGKEAVIEALQGEIEQARKDAAALKERWLREKKAVENVLGLRKELTEQAGAAAPGGSDKPSPAAKARTPEQIRKDLDAALAALREVQGKDPLIQVEAGLETIARVISDWTGIPVGKMVRDEAESMLKLEETLGRRIKGQDHALGIIAQGIRAAKAGLKNPVQPMGVFLLVGPSGVGKTECALGVADLLFGGERFMTTINMSEFQEKHTVSRLIGSPPGYVGYGEGGVLTEAVRQRPYSVVLLDEVEKADPEVMNIFYQVFDKGVLSDGEGRVIDFKDTVIFMTSNLASDTIIHGCSAEKKPALEDLVATIRPELSRHFKPALLARMKIVPFHPIGEEAMRDITRLKLGHVAARLEESHRIALVIAPEVVDTIAARCTEVETGARNVDHILSETLLPRISTEILRRMGEGPMPARLQVFVEKGDLAVRAV